jgi:hypothetical protein
MPYNVMRYTGDNWAWRGRDDLDRSTKLHHHQIIPLHQCLTPGITGHLGVGIMIWIDKITSSSNHSVAPAKVNAQLLAIARYLVQQQVCSGTLRS